MRYTRYNYKPPRKKNNFIPILILTLIAALALGTIFAKLLPKSNPTIGDKTTIALEKENQVNKENVDVPKVITQTNVKDFVAIQCGAFSKKEKSLVLKNSLKNFGTPFIIEEDNLVRVLLGVYPKENIDSITKQLEANKIDYIKINFKITGKDSTALQINEMISAEIKILNALTEKNTSSVQTTDLKKWLTTLQGAEEKSASYVTMTEIKSYLTALPAELKKEKAEEGYIYIYKFIKKISKI